MRSPTPLRWVFFCCGLALLGCLKQVPVAAARPPDAPASDKPAAVAPPPGPSGPGLVFAVEPSNAELVIDGESFGPVSAVETTNGLLPLKPGIYQVALKRPGYVSWRAEVTVREQPERLQVTLVKQ